MNTDAVTHRLHRRFPGERHWKSSPLCQVLARREDVEPGGAVQLREPRASRWDTPPRARGNLPQVRPYAPQLIRLVRHPYAMSGVRVTRQTVMEPRATLAAREPTPATMRLAAEELPRVEAKGPLRDRVLPLVFRQAWRSGEDAP